MDSFTQLQIDWYTFTKNTLKITSFLDSNSYKVRRLAASKLAQLEDMKALPFLLQKVDDAAILVAETVLYAIKVIAKANNYTIDLTSYYEKLEERKAEIPKYRLFADFKFEKNTQVPGKKDLMRCHDRRTAVFYGM